MRQKEIKNGKRLFKSEGANGSWWIIELSEEPYTHYVTNKLAARGYVIESRSSFHKAGTSALWDLSKFKEIS